MHQLPDERLDTVNDDIRLLQKSAGLTFGTDALLLASYIQEKPNARALELGGGSGIISLLLLARKKAAHITVSEIQPDYAALIARNAALNGMQEQLTVLTGDLRALTPAPDDGSFRYVFTNPPYMKPTGLLNREEAKAIARHELHGDIGDFCRVAAAKLTFGGHFYAVYRPERLTDLLEAMRRADIEPKKLTLVHADVAAPPSLVLVMGRRGGGASLVCTPPLILHTDQLHKENSPALSYILEHSSFPPKEREPQ